MFRRSVGINGGGSGIAEGEGEAIGCSEAVSVSADLGVFFIHSLCDVEIELLSGWDTDVEAIPFDGLQNLLGVPVEDTLRAMSGAFCKLGIAKVPKADVRVSVKAEAAPLSKDATNNFISARLSVLSSFPRNPALPSVNSPVPVSAS